MFKNLIPKDIANVVDWIQYIYISILMPIHTCYGYVVIIYYYKPKIKCTKTGQVQQSGLVPELLCLLYVNLKINI